MSFNIRERFRERKFSCKIKKIRDKKKADSITDSNNNQSLKEGL